MTDTQKEQKRSAQSAERNEARMRKKKWTNRVISGFLSAIMMMSAAAAPATAFASELIPEEELKAYVEALPELDQVKDTLDADEIVTAKDLEVEFGAEIDLKKDKFYEAKDADKADFSTGKAGTYKAVYYVEPSNEQGTAFRQERIGARKTW